MTGINLIPPSMAVQIPAVIVGPPKKFLLNLTPFIKNFGVKLDILFKEIIIIDD